MKTPKEFVTLWLRRNGKNREWLAAQCKVSLGAVNQWLSERGVFPELSQKLVSLVIKVEELQQARPQTRMKTLTLQFTDNEWSVIKELAKYDEGSIEEVAEKQLLKVAHSLISDDKKDLWPSDPED